MPNKWIHLIELQTNVPRIGIEGLTDYEAVLWLREAIRMLTNKGSKLEIEKYEERSSG